MDNIAGYAKAPRYKTHVLWKAGLGWFQGLCGHVLERATEAQLVSERAVEQARDEGKICVNCNYINLKKAGVFDKKEGWPTW